MKIAVVGYSGAGKSTLARRLGDIYGLPVLHFDSLNFLPGWKERDREEMRRMVDGFLENQDWVIDGNYPRFRFEERMESADRIIILDLGRAACFSGALKRYLKYRGRTREDMAPGCPEKFDREFAMWILRDGRTDRDRARYRLLREKYPDKTLVFHSRKAVERYLERLKDRELCQQEM